MYVHCTTNRLRCIDIHRESCVAARRVTCTRVQPPLWTAAVPARTLPPCRTVPATPPGFGSASWTTRPSPRSWPAPGVRPPSCGRPRKPVRVLTLADPSVRCGATKSSAHCARCSTRTFARRWCRGRGRASTSRSSTCTATTATGYRCNPPVGARGEAGVCGVDTMSMIDIEMGAELTECDRYWGRAPQGQAAVVPGRVCTSGFFFS